VPVGQTAQRYPQTEDGRPRPSRAELATQQPSETIYNRFAGPISASSAVSVI